MYAVRLAAAGAFALVCLSTPVSADTPPPLMRGPAAGATHGRFEFTTSETFQGAIPECFSPDLVGTNVATETTTGRFTETSHGVFVVSGSNVFDYRVEFPNGMYAEGTGTSHFAFVTTPQVTVQTQAGSEPRTVYSPDGEPVARVRIHAISHVTYRDLNGNGAPDEGEVSSEMDRFFFTCPPV
jgi:hypothetical protein